MRRVTALRPANAALSAALAGTDCWRKACRRLMTSCMRRAAAAVFFVPLFVQTPFLLVLVIALWTGILLFLSLQRSGFTGC